MKSETILNHKVELQPLQNGNYRISVTNGRIISGRVMKRLDQSNNEFDRICSGLRINAIFKTI